MKGWMKEKIKNERRNERIANEKYEWEKGLKNKTIN